MTAGGSDRKRLIRDLRRQGFTVSMAGSGHWKVYAPNGVYVTTMAQTSGSWRGARNEIARLERAGYLPPGRRRHGRRGKS